MRSLYLIELNELNFEYVQHYAWKGRLPCIARLLARYGLGTTTSESVYEHVEPWIQWVTAHTGKTYAEHQIFRLGDIVGRDLDQIWEVLERRGIRVGAVCPLNAQNRLRAPAFFIPDPWTSTCVSGDQPTRLLYQAVAQTVGDSREGRRLTPRSLVGLLTGFLRHVSLAQWPVYLRLASRIHGRPWLKAVILDRLLADVFLNLVGRTRPGFASLFLNAGAHIQHHYMFNSAAYEGERRNPDWYVRSGEDPLLEIYSAYDGILADVLRVDPDARVLIATGLHQEPYPHETFYWRLRDHAAFLGLAGLPFDSAQPLMSRDFVVRSGDPSRVELVCAALRGARIRGDDSTVFEVDNRGNSLFCTLEYSQDIKQGMLLDINGRSLPLYDAVAFVAIKNGHHNQLGYLIDTRASRGLTPVPLTDIYRLVTEHFEPAAA